MGVEVEPRTFVHLVAYVWALISVGAVGVAPFMWVTPIGVYGWLISTGYDAKPQ